MTQNDLISGFGLTGLGDKSLMQAEVISEPSVQLPDVWLTYLNS